MSPRPPKGPPVDPAKGYRLQPLASGHFMVTDNAYQSMFLAYEAGVVVVDAPPSYAAHLKAAIAEVTGKPVTHLIYSHSTGAVILELTERLEGGVARATRMSASSWISTTGPAFCSAGAVNRPAARTPWEW